MPRRSSPRRAVATGLLLLVQAVVGTARAQPATRADLERLTLPQALTRARLRNTDVLLARAQLARARALLVQVRSSSLPTAFGQGVYTRLDEARGAEGFTAAPIGQVTATGTIAIP